MNYQRILVTGGAGFIGSTLAIKFKQHLPQARVVALDNLSRLGSELNRQRLEEHGVEFRHGDVRIADDLAGEPFDLLIECSAEPSVLAGVTSAPAYLVNTNLVGALHCFEAARRHHADIVFLSTSRVYPVALLNDLAFREEATRFVLSDKQATPGVSREGISESFPLEGTRTLYGATKLAAELILAEYAQNYNLKVVIDRLGVVAGPWQMGRVDQGLVSLWIASHLYQRPLSYLGFGGSGKQVRDIIDVSDVWSLIAAQLKDIKRYSGQIFNAGGGLKNSLSLLELTELCQRLTKKKIKIGHLAETRPGDVRVYITDNTKVSQVTGWQPQKSVEQTVVDTYRWLKDNQSRLRYVFS